MHPYPRLIALCGNPGSGKSTAAQLLTKHGYTIADDGLPLRQIAMQHLGLSEWNVSTQAGKLEEVDLNGRAWQAREILGEIGNAFEEKFGGEIIPMMTHRTLQPTRAYVMGSVRRDQGFYWREHGALVLEIVNPHAGPSKFEFDSYNQEPIHARIHNDGQSLKVLERALIQKIEDVRL
jgi:hypothetical protein